MPTRRAFVQSFLLLPLCLVPSKEPPQAAPAADRKRRVHLKDVHVAGVQYHAAAEQQVLHALQPGQELVLKREPGNPYDDRAIAVYTDNGRKIGFVPQRQNRTIARIMDQDVPVKARVKAVNPQARLWESIEIRVEEIV